MERPNKKDYDFNDVFEAVRFASNMIKYADYLEAKQLPIHVVSKRFSDKHEFSKYMTDNKPKQIWLDDFSKEYPYIIIDRYYDNKFIGVYNKQGVIISGKQDDFTWLYKEGMYINVC